MNVYEISTGRAAALRRRAIRCRKRARDTRNEAVAQMIRDLADYLDLEAVIEEAQTDPFRRRSALQRA